MKDPRNEGFFEALKINMCPQLTCYSFAVLFSVIVTCLFFLQISVDGIDKDETKLKTSLLPIYVEGSLSSNVNL